MPELPEVETIARDLRSALINQKVISAKFLNTLIREDGSYKSASVLDNKTLTAISRRGKNLIFHFSDNLALVCHLKMTGRLLLKSLESKQDKHLHFFIQFEQARLNFYDVRKFGRINILDETKIANHPRLNKLGPEPQDILVDDFVNAIRKRDRPIKLVLLDQEIIAGIGNIYADESLFEAGIRPTLKPRTISFEKLRKLHAAVNKILKLAISKRGSSVDDYLDGFGQTGGFQKIIKVYGRTGETCVRCKTPLKRIVLGGRSTHYCPKCQK
jgi:formamidopyrimidine-DNA glycosylase